MAPVVTVAFIHHSGSPAGPRGPGMRPAGRSLRPVTSPSTKTEVTAPVPIYRGLCLPRKKAGWAAFVLFLCPRLVRSSVRKRKSTSRVEAQLPSLWGPWRPALSPWTPKVGQEQEEGSGGGAGLGTLWDLRRPARGHWCTSSPRCPGTELQDLCLGPEQPHPSCWEGSGCPVREPKAQRLGRLPSRSQEAGLAGEQRKDRWGEEEKVPGHHCGVPPSTPVEPRPRGATPLKGYHTLAEPRPMQSHAPRGHTPCRATPSWATPSLSHAP